MYEDDVAFNARNERAEALALLRKESLDIYNRLHSIAEDAIFVEEVHQAYPDIPILPNLRCGEWYTDPKMIAKEAAYFKSTDGHFGNWSFNLRRPNLHLLPLAIANHGMIIVDSTRAGKRMPDALSKTVPIWCAVINRTVLQLRENEVHETCDRKLYTPPGIVSSQESRQIEERIDAWARSLAKSSYTLPHLPLPLRPLWITPVTSVFPSLPAKDRRSFIPVLCVSASKQIKFGVERRQAGFGYVQGSGDDHELWGRNLTPKIFWEHKETLLRCSRSELSAMVEKLVHEDRAHAARNKGVEWTLLPTPIRQVSGALMLCKASDLPGVPLDSLPSEGGGSSTAYVIIDRKDAADSSEVQDDDSATSNVLRLSTPEGKKGQLRFLETVLPRSMSFVQSHLRRGRNVCIACDDGKDISVGIALAALQKFFDDNGELIESEHSCTLKVDKQTIRTRLHWIISSYPLANPSRTTLKRVNEFLLTPPSFRSGRTTSAST